MRGAVPIGSRYAGYPCWIILQKECHLALSEHPITKRLQVRGDSFLRISGGPGTALRTLQDRVAFRLLRITPSVTYRFPNRAPIQGPGPGYASPCPGSSALRSVYDSHFIAAALPGFIRHPKNRPLTPCRALHSVKTAEHQFRSR